MPKLRSYILFKDDYMVETFILKNISRCRRSLISQCRSGILPLEIETGRYTPIYESSRKIENVNHMNEFVNYVTRTILKMNIILYASALYMGRYGKFYFNMPLRKILHLMACRYLINLYI